MRLCAPRVLLTGRVMTLVIAVAALASPKAATPPIDPARILEHIKVLSSDELQGRANGRSGLERAADYIAGGFKDAGIRAAGQDGSGFQPFELTAGVTLGNDNALVLATADRPVRLVLGESYFPLAATPSTSVTTLDDVPVVFGGYGISAPAFEYD